MMLTACKINHSTDWLTFPKLTPTQLYILEECTCHIKYCNTLGISNGTDILYCTALHKTVYCCIDQGMLG